MDQTLPHPLHRRKIPRQPRPRPRTTGFQPLSVTAHCPLRTAHSAPSGRRIHLHTRSQSRPHRLRRPRQIHPLRQTPLPLRSRHLSRRHHRLANPRLDHRHHNSPIHLLRRPRHAAGRRQHAADAPPLAASGQQPAACSTFPPEAPSAPTDPHPNPPLPPQPLAHVCAPSLSERQSEPLRPLLPCALAQLRNFVSQASFCDFSACLCALCGKSQLFTRHASGLPRYSSRHRPKKPLAHLPPRRPPRLSRHRHRHGALRTSRRDPQRRRPPPHHHRQPPRHPRPLPPRKELAPHAPRQIRLPPQPPSENQLPRQPTPPHHHLRIHSPTL